MRSTLTLVVVATSALITLVITGWTFARDGCTSIIQSYEGMRCYYTTVNCQEPWGCTSPGLPCSFCPEDLVFAYCEEHMPSSCLQLDDCDGCGFQINGICEWQNGVLVCLPQDETNTECRRLWCANY